MTAGIRIGRVRGIPIYVHATWFAVFLLVSLTLNSHLLQATPQYGAFARWVAALSTSLLFFGSIVLHELGHSVVAMRHGVPVRSITLFVFGGVAMMEGEADRPRGELQIAIAGPATSALLGLGFLLLSDCFEPNTTDAVMFHWLSAINFIVAAFNLLPGLPLDGGRALRAVLWARGGDALRATRLAARAGQALAYLLIALGVSFAFAWGQKLTGLWLVCIGWFLLMAAAGAVRQSAPTQ